MLLLNRSQASFVLQERFGAGNVESGWFLSLRGKWPYEFFAKGTERICIHNRSYAFGKSLRRFMFPGRCSLFILEYGIWPTSEDRWLYKAMKGELGSNKYVDEEPGMVFSREEVEVFASFLSVSMLFGFGGIVFSDHGGIFVFSHDDWVFAASERRMDFIEGFFRD